ncbi:MAG TPA: glycosyltransferase family protein [Chitinophagaceae bacterium]|nr:glycosyltransferase family protein [Chitinophagaceae bacterium]
MKIFYAIQATGNGHISRAMELLPHLHTYGQVDIFLSGANSHLSLDAPVKFRSKGVSLFYNCNGGLDYFQMLKNYHPLDIRQQIRDLPVEKYDLVINDFEYITSAACSKKNIPSINYGHQASFLSAKTPRPAKRSQAGEWILKNYARATNYVGLHFSRYDDFIFTPVIKKEILDATPTDKNYVSVYLPSFCKEQLEKIFSPLADYQFQVFTKEIKTPEHNNHISFLPINKSLFNQSLLHCTGIITGGGFETPAEAIHLGKKIMSIPIKGQYEQACNSAALEKMGITCQPVIGKNFKTVFIDWMNKKEIVRLDYSNSITESLEYLFNLHQSLPRDLRQQVYTEAEPWKI